jgi:hypothetical protein
MKPDFRYEKGRTEKGLICESYNLLDTKGNKCGDSDQPIVIMPTGLAVKPGEFTNGDYVASSVVGDFSTNPFFKGNYLGDSPSHLAARHGLDVKVLYQPAVSGNGHKKGMYSEATKKLMFEEILTLAEGRLIYLVSHSLSTDLHTDILMAIDYTQKDRGQFLPGALSGIMTTAKDSLTNRKGKSRKIAGIPWYWIFKTAEATLPAFPCALPIYPLANQELHDGLDSEEKNVNWAADRWINPATAKNVMKIDNIEKTRGYCGQAPLSIITTEDAIFDPEGQHQVVGNLGAISSNISAGHRWFTHKNRKGVARDIAEHLKWSKPLESRL